MNPSNPQMTCRTLAMEGTVPAGTYFLGDPCYAVPKELWDELLASCDCFASPIGLVQKHQVIAFSASYGNRIYVGTDGCGYRVESGFIGLTPMALAPAHTRGGLNKRGRVLDFDREMRFLWQDGLFICGERRIDTRFPSMFEEANSDLAREVAAELKGRGTR